jgi:GntR family transcriptional regulator
MAVFANPTSSAAAPSSSQAPAAYSVSDVPSLVLGEAEVHAAVANAVEYGDHCYRASDYSINLMVDER